MNNDLEQFSEERLKNIIELADNPTMAALARIALAAKQAKPVAITDRGEIAGLIEDGWVGNFMAPSYKGVDKGDEVWLYTTPQPAHTELMNSPELPDGWIKISDRLPDDDTLCLAIDDCGVIWTMHFTEDDFYPDTGDICPDPLTHWMPLPPPPVAAPKPESE